MPTALLFLMLADVPRPDATLVSTHDLAALTADDARRMSDRPVRVAFTVASLIDDHEGVVTVEAASPEGERRKVQLAKGADVGDIAVGRRVVVEGELRLRRYPAAVIDGAKVGEVVEVQVRSARRFRP